MNSLAGRTTALQVKAASDDVESHTYACNSNDFMDNFFGEPVIDLSLVLERLKDKGVYELEQQDSTDKAGRWKEFPDSQKNAMYLEKSYHVVLENICNSILQDDSIKAYKNTHEGPFVEGFWFDRSAHVPKSLVPGTPAIRATLIFFLNLMHASGLHENKQIVKKIQEIEKKRSQHGKKTNKRNNNNPDDTKTVGSVDWIREELQTIFLSWLRSIAVLEVRPFDAYGQEAKDTIIQLATYLRQTLRNQHDRRFVFGMILFHDKLSLWYCDRSGLLGTYDPIDIHKSPKDFIRVISSLALMTPWKLGWDKTMKIAPKTGSSRPYYYHSLPSGITAKDLPTAQDDLRWEITIKETVFRTVQSLSTAPRSEIMCGRATMVWLAVCVNDGISAEEAAPVVIKHSWRSCSEDSHCEHESFERAYGNDSKDIVVLSHDEPGSNTVKDLRGDIPCVAITNSYRLHSFIEQQMRKRNEQKSMEPSDDEGCDEVPNLFEYIPFFGTTHHIAPRCQYRIVLSNFGWPLEAFKNLGELLNVFRGTIEEYECMYNNGVCHHDISIGNIVIDYVTGKGRLIDLDSSKMLELQSHRKQKIGDIKNDMTADELEQWEKKISAWKVHSHFSILDEVFIAALNHSYPTDANGGFAEIRTIIAANIELMGLVEQHQDDAVECVEEKVTITPENTGVMIDKDTILPPTFRDHHPTHTFRTGTKAFMSHRQLANRPPPHKAVHDMESIFWVALHIFITREGPGGQRREEFASFAAAKLEKDTAKEDQSWNLIRVTNLLFETSREEIATVKRDMFKHPEYFKEYVLPLIHPYFEPLSPLLLSWWRILTLAFSIDSQTRDYNTRNLYCDFIIAPFKAAVVDAINQLPARTTPTSKEQEVEDYRQKRRWEIKEETIRLKALYPQHSTSEPAIIQESQSTIFGSQIDPSKRSTTPENHPLYSSSGSAGLPEAPSSKKAKHHHD